MLIFTATILLSFFTGNWLFIILGVIWLLIAQLDKKEESKTIVFKIEGVKEL